MLKRNLLILFHTKTQIHRKITKYDREKESQYYSNLQSGSEDDDKERSVITSISLNILVNPEPSLRRRRRERVRVQRAEEHGSPRRGLGGGEVVGGELGDGIESQKREKGNETAGNRGGGGGGGLRRGDGGRRRRRRRRRG